MSRRRPRRPAPPPLSVAGWVRREQGVDGSWEVRAIPGGQSGKTYRCPGCDHEIRPGVAHVVVWPSDGPDAAEWRRHWHSPCWDARERRGPTRRRW